MGGQNRNVNCAVQAKYSDLSMPSGLLGRGPQCRSRRRFDLKDDEIKVLIVDDYAFGAHALADYLQLEDMAVGSGANRCAESVKVSSSTIL